MSIEKILAISGKPGLYALKLQTRTGFVAESLIDGKKITVGLRSNVSLLSEISVYTYGGEVRLSEVFTAIAEKEDDGAAISHKEDNATLVAYFREVMPEFDEDRVYTSDIKKILNWYNMLQAKGLVSKALLKADEPTEAPVEEEAPKTEE
ncbi:hypothetical protein DVK85_12325 [Flavobacterium arcticum]|uniref:Uncharacterized protein n=1 Tax=Flavobacterium arcticum TaxID=1784713 RepID=A0A345HEG3_9FLAO|nr:DUF5606 domain-containing protein [Flavobacterium arcticum]AXG74973.1 hypothetical protein DVK85_12325 [Flavobacterium arcticum]KAF2506525.1 hypothetical protein E0W72_12900 [Flavobacterium arcticum]